MRLTIVGKEVVDYCNKAGNQVKGVRLYYTCSPSKSGVEGCCAGEEYFSDKYAPYSMALAVAVGDEVDAYYNQRGYLDTLMVVPPSPAPAVAPDKK
mgnify:CR=1 FL=1